MSIQPDTGYSEMVSGNLQECLNRGAEKVTIPQSHLPQPDTLDRLGFVTLTEDVMLMKSVVPKNLEQF